jgi:hypothetical protein
MPAEFMFFSKLTVENECFQEEIGHPRQIGCFTPASVSRGLAPNTLL